MIKQEGDFFTGLVGNVNNPFHRPPLHSAYSVAPKQDQRRQSMNEIKVSKGAFHHVENELYDYHDTKRAIIRIKNELLYASPSHENTGGGRSSLPSDPTGRTASLMASHRQVMEMERVIAAIDAIRYKLPDEKQRLITLRYWTRPQLLTWHGIAKEIHCGERTARYWRSEIVFAIAHELGWK